MENSESSICIISFSAMKQGNCISVANYIKGIYGKQADLFSFKDFTINPCGKCN